jgi:tetratricopeptide (TPR) repeat protein
MDTKKLAFVTCLYDLVKRGSAEHRSIDWMIDNAGYVLGLDHELVIFTDPELELKVRALRGDRRTKIVPIPYEKLLGGTRCAAIVGGTLQHNARKSKVTSSYVQLMWAKYAMLEMALEITAASHIGWIDLGITHVAKLPPKDVDVFADPSDQPRVHVLRCFDKRDVDQPAYWLNVQGHLAGGLVVGARANMRDLIGDFWKATDLAIAKKLAPLDEGLLSYVVAQRPDDFSYSYGDYEDIVRNHAGNHFGETHRAWIVDDARSRGLSPTMGSLARPSSRPLLGLVMIVKNEARRIAEVLASYRSHIDAWTILDTGSTDGTQDLIRDVLANIPGTLHEEPFVDFATSRNRALALHGDATVFTIMPNGDVLQGGDALRLFLKAHRNDHAGAYRVRISPGHYYHPLVMRTGAGWHYKWRTHECAVGPSQGPAIPNVMVIRDRGSRTDEEWKQRWTRDLDLLHRDREADPSDPRPYFYLGQTHECLGQYAEALGFFERRAELGGYFDEVYEAKYRIAKMKAKLGRSWAEIQQSYLDAYAHDPRRAEPLHAIAEYWHDKEKHALTRLFATTAAEMPKPPTDLFLDEEIYTWKAADLAAISSYYSGHKEEGRRFADRAVRQRPDDERLRANRAFYARSAADMFGATLRPLAFQPEQGWNASNPSLCRGPDGLRCIVRTVNYTISADGKYVTPAGDGVICTRNFLLDLDDDLRTTRSVELLDEAKNPRTNFPIHGFEDARLFFWRGGWWATATVCDFTQGQREIALLQLDVERGAIVRAEALRGPWSKHAQKNWMPRIDGDDAKIIYATQPTTIFDLVEADEPDVRRLSWHIAERHAIGCEVDDAASGTFAHGRLRGGSQAVRTAGGGWIFVVHDVAFPGSGRIYLHRFAMLDDQLKLVALSDPFYFEQLHIEFCAGLAPLGDKLVASYAVNDGSARLGIFEWEKVQKTLRTDFVI